MGCSKEYNCEGNKYINAHTKSIKHNKVTITDAGKFSKQKEKVLVIKNKKPEIFTLQTTHQTTGASSIKTTQLIAVLHFYWTTEKNN